MTTGLKPVHRWLLGAACAAMLAAAPAAARAFEDGHQLLKFAGIHQDKGIYGMYLGYVTGAADFMEALNVICPGKITNKDIANAVLLWMRRNPDKLDFSSLDVTALALTYHFPCD